MAAKWQQFTKEQLQEFINQSFSNCSFVKLMGYSGKGGNTAIVVEHIKETYPDLDFSHFTGQAWNRGKTKEKDGITIGQEKYTLEEVFTQNSPVTQKGLRGYVHRHNVLPYKCVCCGCDGSWMGGTISLELHHINGINNDNRVENLEYLCPNCHALTDNYRGLNKKE
jgi:predicted restriction endonuclease